MMSVLRLTVLPDAIPVAGGSMRSHFSCFAGRAPRPRLRLHLHWLALSLLLAGGPSALSQAGAQATSQSVNSVHRLLIAHAVKFAPALRADLAQAAQRDSRQTLPVIIQTDGTVPASVRSLANAAPGRSSFAAFKAARSQASALIALNAHGTLAARLTVGEIARLAADPHARHISPDLPIRACDAGAYLDYTPQSVGADFLLSNNNLTGQNVTVAVVDTGIYPHDDLTQSAQRIVGWADLVNNAAAPYDDNGHGTHVAGLVAGNGADAVRYGYAANLTRIAPQANLVGRKSAGRERSGKCQRGHRGH